MWKNELIFESRNALENEQWMRCFKKAFDSLNDSSIPDEMISDYWLIFKMSRKNIKLPQHLQLDTVSPATKLLEKRRMMYEVQEAF